MSGKKIIGEGSTENKVIRLADHVAGLGLDGGQSGGGMLGRVILTGHGGADAGGAEATGPHTSKRYSVIYTSESGIKDLSPSKNKGAFVNSIERGGDAKPSAAVYGLYLPSISQEQDELAKRYFDDRVGHRLSTEEKRDVAREMMVYEVEFSHTSEVIIDGQRMVDLYSRASQYFNLKAVFKFYQEGREYSLTKLAPWHFEHYHQYRGQMNLITLAITSLSYNVYMSDKFNDGEQIDNIGRFNISGIVYLPASPMDKKEIVILGPASTTLCRAAVTDYKINRVVRMGDLSDFDTCNLAATGDFVHDSYWV